VRIKGLFCSSVIQITIDLVSSLHLVHHTVVTCQLFFWLGFGTNLIGYSGVISCVELCDKDDENNALHHRDCVCGLLISKH